MKLLAQEASKVPEFSDFNEFKPLFTFFDKQEEHSQKLKKLITLLETDSLQTERSLFTNQGVVLAAYGLMTEIKGDFENALAAAGRLEAYFSLAKLFQEERQGHTRYCFARYVQADRLSIVVQDFWHPLIDDQKVITNSLTLEIDGQRPNLIVTGPNEGGKSTILKTLALCLLMAQTVGIVPAHAFSFTLFASIATYLNITDDIGAGNSLFKAEVLRVQALLDRIKNLKPDEFNFVIFDEVQDFVKVSKD
jgi:DNA mismatch repair protein MutS